MFAKTASTNCEKNPFEISDKKVKGQLRKKTMSSDIRKNIPYIETPPKEDKAVSNIQPPIERVAA